MSSSAGVIDFFIHPPLGLLSAFLDTSGPFSGQGTLTTLEGNAVSASNGVAVVVSGAIPVDLGYTDGWVAPTGLFDGIKWEQRLWQLVVQHQLLSGLWVTTQEVDSHSLAQMVLWDEAAPGRLGYYVLPGLAIELYRIALLP